MDADLRVEVDGVPAQVSGQGQDITVVTDRPAALWRAVLDSSPTNSSTTVRTLRGLADALAESGLTVTVPAPIGVSVRAGAAVRSRLSGRVTGSPHIEVGLGAQARRGLVRALGGLLGVILTAIVVRSLGRSRSS